MYASVEFFNESNNLVVRVTPGIMSVSALTCK